VKQKKISELHLYSAFQLSNYSDNWTEYSNWNSLWHLCFCFPGLWRNGSVIHHDWNISVSKIV